MPSPTSEAQEQKAHGCLGEKQHNKVEKVVCKIVLDHFSIWVLGLEGEQHTFRRDSFSWSSLKILRFPNPI